jgi:hypothetical protein
VFDVGLAAAGVVVEHEGDAEDAVSAVDVDCGLAGLGLSRARRRACFRDGCNREWSWRSRSLCGEERRGGFGPRPVGGGPRARGSVAERARWGPCGVRALLASTGAARPASVWF